MKKLLKVLSVVLVLVLVMAPVVTLAADTAASGAASGAFSASGAASGFAPQASRPIIMAKTSSRDRIFFIILPPKNNNDEPFHRQKDTVFPYAFDFSKIGSSTVLRKYENLPKKYPPKAGSVRHLLNYIILA